MSDEQRQRWREYLDTVAAGRYTGYSPRTLEKLRWSGGGPAYYRHNGIRYLKEDLDEWLESGRRTSTSDPGPQS